MPKNPFPVDFYAFPAKILSLPQLAQTCPNLPKSIPFAQPFHIWPIYIQFPLFLTKIALALRTDRQTDRSTDGQTDRSINCSKDRPTNQPIDQPTDGQSLLQSCLDASKKSTTNRSRVIPDIVQSELWVSKGISIGAEQECHYRDQVHGKNG